MFYTKTRFNKTQKVDMTFSKEKTEGSHEVLLSRRARKYLGLDVDDSVIVYNYLDRSMNTKATINSVEKYQRRGQSLGNTLIQDLVAEDIGFPSSPLSYLYGAYRIFIERVE